MQVDFECVPDLVAGRKVLLRRGKAYISSSDLASLVVGTFRQAHWAVAQSLLSPSLRTVLWAFWAGRPSCMLLLSTCGMYCAAQSPAVHCFQQC